MLGDVGCSEPFGAGRNRFVAGPDRDRDDSWVVATLQTLRSAQTASGEIVLRRRGQALELIVNGVFAMDSREVGSERALADAVGAPPGSVLVGGLGLGFTAARLLDNGAEALAVVESAAPLIRWAHEGVTEQLACVAADPRVQLHEADIVSWLPASAAMFDAIVLDVDNGPTFLIHQPNARLYSRGWLGAARDHLRPSGRLVIWCESRCAELQQTLLSLGRTTETLLRISREGRSFDYALYTMHAGG